MLVQPSWIFLMQAFLMTLEAQDNDCDLMDPEVIAI